MSRKLRLKCPACQTMIETIVEDELRLTLQCAACNHQFVAKVPPRTTAPQQKATTTQARPTQAKAHPRPIQPTAQQPVQAYRPSPAQAADPLASLPSDLQFPSAGPVYRPAARSAFNPRVLLFAGMGAFGMVLMICLGLFVWRLATTVDLSNVKTALDSGGAATVENTAPSTLLVDLEEFHANGDLSDVEQLNKFAKRLSTELKRLSGNDVLATLNLVFEISKKNLGQTNDPEISKASWQLGQTAFDQYFRICVNTSFYLKHNETKAMGELLERMLKLGDTKQSIEATRELAASIANDLKAREEPLTHALTSAIRENNPGQRVFFEDQAEWGKANWITKELIEVACHSPETIPIATELVFANSRMNQISSNANAIWRSSNRGEQGPPPNVIGHRTSDPVNRPGQPAPTQPGGPFGQGPFGQGPFGQGPMSQRPFAQGANPQGSTPNPPRNVWILSANSFFAPKAESDAVIRTMFPERKWNLRDSQLHLMKPSSFAKFSFTINGDPVELQFNSEGFEWNVSFLLEVDNENELRDRLKGYNIREFNSGEKRVSFDLNLPKR